MIVEEYFVCTVYLICSNFQIYICLFVDRNGWGGEWERIVAFVNTLTCQYIRVWGREPQPLLVMTQAWKILQLTQYHDRIKIKCLIIMTEEKDQNFACLASLEASVRKEDLLPGFDIMIEAGPSHSVRNHLYYNDYRISLPILTFYSRRQKVWLEHKDIQVMMKSFIPLALLWLIIRKRYCHFMLVI